MSAHGIALTFETPEALTEAARKLHDSGYLYLEAYTPFPIDEVEELLQRKSKLPLVTLICGILGGVGGYFLEYFTAVLEYPLNVGGRPLNSWQAFIPITFEMTVLSAGVGIFVAFFIFTKLPQLYHPIFNMPGSDRITDDRFVLCLEARDPLFTSQKIRAMISECGAMEVSDVEA